MLETAWESRWMPDSIKNNSLNAIWDRTDTSEWMNYLWWGCVNLLQQGSAVPYNWFLPVIREFKNLSFLMTDKNVSQTCTCTLQFESFAFSLTCRHVMKTKHSESLWKQAFNAFETFCFRNVPWKLHIENLIQSSNWKVWNKYQDIRGVTRKCNQTNQKQAIINCKHHKPKMQRYASERNTVPAVWINWLS